MGIRRIVLFALTGCLLSTSVGCSSTSAKTSSTTAETSTTERTQSAAEVASIVAESRGDIASEIASFKAGCSYSVEPCSLSAALAARALGTRADTLVLKLQQTHPPVEEQKLVDDTISAAGDVRDAVGRFDSAGDCTMADSTGLQANAACINPTTEVETAADALAAKLDGWTAFGA